MLGIDRGMVVIFGASSDVGRRLTALLLDRGSPIRVVARDLQDLDARAERVCGDISSAADFVQGASKVISCAHARFIPHLLSVLPPATELVCLGSAWRHSRVPNPRADQVRAAEAAFLSSGAQGIMMHPTMMYGGTQEQNLQRLLRLLRICPVLPLPGGGKNLVQPIHVDDVANCLYAASTRTWVGAHVITIAGPRALTWRDMTATLARVARVPFIPVSVPLSAAILAASALHALTLGRGFDPNVLRRFREDVQHSTDAMTRMLSVSPRELDDGLEQMLARA